MARPISVRPSLLPGGTRSRTSPAEPEDRRARSGEPGADHAVPGRDGGRAGQGRPEEPAAVEGQRGDQVGQEQDPVQVAEPADPPDRGQGAGRTPRSPAEAPPNRRRGRTGSRRTARRRGSAPTAVTTTTARLVGRPRQRDQHVVGRPRHRPTARPCCPAARAGPRRGSLPSHEAIAACPSSWIASATSRSDEPGGRLRRPGVPSPSRRSGA